MPYRHRVTVLLAAAALATAAALLTFAAAAGAADVTIANKAFGPNAAAIAPGQSVTWHWGDGPHSVHVTAGPEQFDSGIKPAGSSYTKAFTAAGVYTYQCDVHPSMHGQVVVGGPSAAAPALPVATAAAPPLRAAPPPRPGACGGPAGRARRASEPVGGDCGSGAGGGGGGRGGGGRGRAARARRAGRAPPRGRGRGAPPPPPRRGGGPRVAAGPPPTAT